MAEVDGYAEARRRMADKPLGDRGHPVSALCFALNSSRRRS